MVRSSLSLSATDFWFLKVFKFLECYHQVILVFCCLGYWNELTPDWHQLFKLFPKEFLFFCYFEKMNDFKHTFGTYSWIKNSGCIANIWTFENTTIGSIFNDQYSSPCTFPFLYIRFSLSAPNTFFSHICLCVFMLESHCFRNCP